MAHIRYGPELGAFYTLINPQGLRATFNDPEDPDFCGVLSEITGLDSAEVRDSGDVLADADGGYTGNNYYGRRPITMTGTMYGYETIAERNIQMSKIRTATNAMKLDGTMLFTGQATDAIEMLVNFRRQQPTRFSGGWTKTFNISLVSTLVPIINSVATVTSPAASVVIENQGDYNDLPPDMITITGYTSGTLILSNSTTGGIIQFLPSLATYAGHTLQLYPQTHQLWDVTLGQWINGQIDFVNSNWFGLNEGNNTIGTNLGNIAVTWHSAWV